MSLKSLQIYRMMSRVPSYGSAVYRFGDSYKLFWNLGVRALTSFSVSNCTTKRESILSRSICSSWSQRQTLPLSCSFLSKHLHTSCVRWSHSSGGNDGSLGNPQEQGSLPPLMNFPPIIWPRFMNAIRNWFFIHFIIKPYFDKEFSMQEFLIGAKEAVAVVANKLSEGKLDELEGLVDPSALAQIRESLSKFTVFQQQLLRVAVEDIFFTFPYQIGIIIPDEATPSPQEGGWTEPSPQSAEGVKRPPQTRHVEITVSLHVLRGIAEKHKSGELGNAFNFQEFAQEDRNKLNFMVCNYRFFRDFTEGNPDPSWIINMVNHFLPMELQRQ